LRILLKKLYILCWRVNSFTHFWIFSRVGKFFYISVLDAPWTVLTITVTRKRGPRTVLGLFGGFWQKNCQNWPIFLVIWLSRVPVFTNNFFVCFHDTRDLHLLYRNIKNGTSGCFNRLKIEKIKNLNTRRWLAESVFSIFGGLPQIFLIIFSVHLRRNFKLYNISKNEKRSFPYFRENWLLCISQSESRISKKIDKMPFLPQNSTLNSIRGVGRFWKKIWAETTLDIMLWDAVKVLLHYFSIGNSE
jgi:hypothetical protein